MTKFFGSFVSVWTNFTPDHIDWHNGLENYFNAKTKAFKYAAFAVLNAKDEKLVEFANNLKIDKDTLFFLTEISETIAVISKMMKLNLKNSEM